MGKVASKICGGEGPLKMLMKEYGDDIGKFIVIEKVKNYVDEKIKEVKEIIDTESGQLKNQTFGEIQMKEKQLQDTFQQQKQQLNRKVPGGIRSLEKIKGQSIQEMLGFNEFKDRFTQLKSTVDTRFNQEKDNVFNQIDRRALQQKEKLDQQRPNVPLYDQLSESHQKLVFQEGEKIFEEQIQKQQGVMKEELDEKLDVNNFLEIFKSIAPNSSIVGMVEGFKVKIESITNLLKGGSLGDIARDIF